MENQTLNIFKEEFETRLCLIENPICRKCNATLKYPLLPWIVGRHYEYSNERLLFVGKPYRGNSGLPGEKFPSGVLDPTKPHLDWLMSCSWPYWRYTREILENIYACEYPWNYAALTNIIKCTNAGSTSLDKTSYIM